MRVLFRVISLKQSHIISGGFVRGCPQAREASSGDSFIQRRKGFLKSIEFTEHVITQVTGLPKRKQVRLSQKK